MEGCGGEWFGVPVPRFFLCVGALHPIRRQCTSSVRVHRHVTGAPPHNGCSAPVLLAVVVVAGGVGCLLLGLSSAWGLCGASCCGSSEMSHVIPRHVFQTLKSHRWNCNVLGCCTKFGHPNYVRVLVDEAPEANSCVRSSSHDTVHNPRDASNTTPTPQNAKSRISRTALQDEPALLTAHPHSHQAQLLQPAIGRHIRSGKGSMRHVGASQRLKCCNLNHRAGPDPMPTPPPTPHNAKSRLSTRG